MRALIAAGISADFQAFVRSDGVDTIKIADDSSVYARIFEEAVAYSFDPTSDLLAVIKRNNSTTAEFHIHETRGFTRLQDLTASLGYISGVSNGGDEGYFLRFSPDGTKLAVGMKEDPWVQIFDTATWTPYSTPATPYAAGTTSKINLDWSPDSRYLAIGYTQSPTARLHIYDCNTTTPVHVVSKTSASGHLGRGVAWSPDGTRLVWGARELDAFGHVPSVYETTGWTVTGYPNGYDGNACRCVDWQGNYVLFSGREVSVFTRVFNTGGSNDPALWTFTDPTTDWASSARVACLTRGTSDVGIAVHLMDSTVGFAFPADTSGANYSYASVGGGLAYAIDAKGFDEETAPTPKRVAVAGNASPWVRFLDETGAVEGTLLSPEPEASAIAQLYPDNSKIVVSYTDSGTFVSEVRVYDAASGALLGTPWTGADSSQYVLPAGAAVSPDGTKIAVLVNYSPGVLFFNASTYAAYSAVDVPVNTDPGDDLGDGTVRWSPDSRYCAVLAYDQWGMMVRRVYDTLTTSPALVAAANLDGSGFNSRESGDWSPDGTRFLSGFDDGDGVIKIYDTSTWAEAAQPTAQPEYGRYSVRWVGETVYLWAYNQRLAYYYDTGGSNDATTWTLHAARSVTDGLLQLNAALPGTPDALVQVNKFGNYEKSLLLTPPTQHHAQGFVLGDPGFSQIYDVSMVENLSGGTEEAEAEEEFDTTDSYSALVYLLLTDSIGGSDSPVGQAIKNILEGLAGGDATSGSPMYPIIERVGVSDSLATQAILNTAVMEAISAADRLGAIFPVVLAEITALDENWTGHLVAIGELLDTLNALDSVTSRLDAAAIVALGMALGEQLLKLSAAEIAETIDANEVLAPTIVANVVMIEALDTATSVLGGRAALVGLSEALAGADTFDPLARIKVLVDEGVEFEVELMLFGDIYQGWVVNNDTLAPSEYENFPFNSMARVGQKYFGASESGLYELDGDTDAGDPIAARILTGETDFGSPQMKRVERAYMGYTTTGELVLKVLAQVEGQKTEFWYRAKPLRTGEVTETRVPIGRGLVSRYWQFEWVNVDGADFELDRLDFQVLITSRRI